MVAFVGIVATAILLTLQPAFAASDIYARQVPSVNGSSIPASCRDLGGCVAILNITDISPQALCTSALINSLESCYQCGVQAGAMNQSEVDSIISAYLSECAEASITVTGISSVPASTGTASSTAASTSATSDASNLSMSAFGIIITSILGTIALL